MDTHRHGSEVTGASPDQLLAAAMSAERGRIDESCCQRLSCGSAPSKRDSRAALPWLVFGVGFFLTTAIGATIIGVSNGERWGIDEMRRMNLGIDTDAISNLDYEARDYWLVLVMPIVMTFCGAVLAWRIRWRPSSVRSQSDLEAIIAARFLFLVTVLWLLARIWLLVPNAPTTIIEAWNGSLDEHYRVRSLIMSALSPFELGLAYTGILVLLTVPLRRALISAPGMASWIEVAIWYGLYGFLALVFVQKLLIAFALLLLAFSFCTARNLLSYWKSLVFILAMFVGLIHLAMSALLPSWSLGSTADHIFGRSADSYPYAMAAAPKHPFGLGQYIAGSVLGGPAILGEAISPNADLYEMMYPESEGAVALAAPVWSYYDVGLTGALLTLGLIALVCSAATFLVRFVEASPWGWSMFLLLLLQIYHLTQIPIVGVLFWSYGIFNGLFALLSLWILARAIGSWSTPRQSNSSPCTAR